MSVDKSIFSRIKKVPTAYFGLCVITFMLILAILSLCNISLTPYSYDQTSGLMLNAPSLIHPMGTDELGRDLLTRIIYGSRLSIVIGLTVALIAFIFGTIYGAVAGYCGGKIDALMMRIIDIAYSLPDLLIMILMGIVIGRGTLGILIALGLVSWMGTARLVRAKFLELIHEEFIEAAHASGQGSFAIILKHMLPNSLGPIIVAVTFVVPSAIIAESTLSFIGLGLSPPACSWGTLAAEGFHAFTTYPHLIFFPSLFIFLTVLSFNFLGDGLQDMFNPKTRS